MRERSAIAGYSGAAVKSIALRLDRARRPILDPKRRVGCRLRVLVCPGGAILSSGKRVFPR